MDYEQIRISDFLTAHDKIKGFYVNNLRDHLSEEVNFHLFHGFIVRADMLKETIKYFRVMTHSIPQNGLEPSDSDKLTLFLNSYYLNLVGSLDNLAWAIATHHCLTNDYERNKNKICLEHHTFQQWCQNKRLSNLFRIFSSAIGGYSSVTDWIEEIKEIHRHPAAHRIPLYVPMRILTNGDGDEYNTLQEQIDKPYQSGDFRLKNELKWKQRNLGSFKPIFSCEIQGKTKLFKLTNKVNMDHDIWLVFISQILNSGFISPRRQININDLYKETFI